MMHRSNPRLIPRSAKFANFVRQGQRWLCSTAKPARTVPIASTWIMGIPAKSTGTSATRVPRIR